MSKIAVIAGVSEYTRLSDLPACKNDALLVSQLIDQTNKFDQVLLLTEQDTKSASFKSKISQFFEAQITGDEIEELFFYFSGHGLVENGNFLFALSDYDDAKVSKTCYSNNELDDTIRALKPKLTVKVVDACHSGQQYIKDAQDFSVAFEKGAKDSLGNLYFLFSSASSQLSYCDANYSYFTRSIADGIANHETGEVRYRDLIDSATDAFRSNAEQRPYFVVQAINTELFGSFSGPNKQAIADFLNKPALNGPVKQNILSPSLAALLEEKAKNYVSLEDVQNAVREIGRLVSTYEFSADIVSVFSLTTDTKEVKEKKAALRPVAEFVESHSDTALAKVVYGNTFVKAEIGMPARVTKPVDYEHLVKQLPFEQVDLYLRPKLRGLAEYTLSVLYVLSANEAFVFGIVLKTESHELVGTSKTWRMGMVQAKCMLKDLSTQASNLGEFTSQFEALVLADLRKAAGLDEPETSTTPS